MSAGLDASTVTPGSKAPDASTTVPAIEAVAWAKADVEKKARNATGTSTAAIDFSIGLSSQRGGRAAVDT